MRPLGCQIKRIFYEQGAQYGFYGARASLYRCYGQGLLQIITLSNPSKSMYEAYFGVFSLYSKLNWISSITLRSVLQYDLHVSHNVRQIPGCEELYIQDLQKGIPIMLEKINPFFDALNTHIHLAEMLERFDENMYSAVRQNDSNKIVPYILSGQSDKAVNCITAIEQQNWRAYAENKENVVGYEQVHNEQTVTRKLSPLVSLRDALTKQDRDAVLQYLHTNYENNANQLRKLGVPIISSCCDQLNNFLSDAD